MKLGIYTATLNGHRKSYCKTFLEIFSSVRIDGFSLINHDGPVIFLMIEESFFKFVIVSVLRSVIGKETYGLLFRPKPVVDGLSLRLKLKKYILILFKRLDKIGVILIMPTHLDPGFSDISKSWIYDMQLWDLTSEHDDYFSGLKNGFYKHECLYSRIQSSKKGRPVIGAIGAQNGIKRFDFFVNEYKKSISLRKRFLFAFAGKVGEFRELIKPFSEVGGFSLDAFITEKELLQIYAVSDLVWAFYADTYDQASGIFGRSVQLGIPVVVREGSLIHKHCVIDGIPHIPLSHDGLDEIAHMNIPEVDIALGKSFRESFKKQSVLNLNQLIGIDIENTND